MLLIMERPSKKSSIIPYSANIAIEASRNSQGSAPISFTSAPKGHKPLRSPESPQKILNQRLNPREKLYINKTN